MLQNLFSFNNELYVQHEGVPMGSPLTPILANFAMDMLESQFSKSSVTNPLVYLRYVDDVFAVFRNKDEAIQFLAFLNSLHPSLSFTIEFEKDFTLPLRDFFLPLGIEKHVILLYSYLLLQLHLLLINVQLF